MILVCCVAIAIAGSWAAAEENDAGFWATAAFQRQWHESLAGSFFFQTRFEDGISEVNRYVLRPSLSKKLESGLIMTLGYDAHLIESPRDRLEQRIWQQLSYADSLSGFDLQYRLRLEERVIEGLDEVVLRPRLLLGISRPIAGSAWYGKVSEELFFHLNSAERGPRSGYDQTRTFLGFGRSFGDGSKIEVGYQLQHINRPGNDLLNHLLMVSYSR